MRSHGGFAWGLWTMAWSSDFNCKENPLEGSDTNKQRTVWGGVMGKMADCWEATAVV